MKRAPSFGSFLTGFAVAVGIPLTAVVLWGPDAGLGTLIAVWAVAVGLLVTLSRGMTNGR